MLSRFWFVSLVAVGGLFAPSVAKADGDEPQAYIPVGEIGLSLPIVHREGAVMPGDSSSTTSIGGAMRVDISVIGLFARGKRLRFGDFVGIELGVASQSLFVGHWRFGGQVSYEVTRELGFGLRAYSDTIFDDEFAPSSNAKTENLLVGEAAIRYTTVIARVRSTFAKADNSGYDASQLGLSVRAPVSWKLMGYSGWQLGADYDRYSYGSNVGDRVLHRLLGVLALAY